MRMVLKFRWETEFKKMDIREIPREWKSGNIGDVIKKIIKGKTPRLKNARSNELVPYLSVGYLRDVENPELYPIDAGTFVNDKDVLIIWDGAANAGEIILAKKGIIGYTLSVLIFKEGFNRYYFYRLFKLFQDEIKSLRSGTDDRHVDKSAFLDFRISLPPLPEQSRIATVLSWFDDLIENKKRQNEILEKTAMAIFKSWFVDFEPFKDEEFVYSEELGIEIPEGWEVRKIRELIKIESGGSAPQGKNILQMVNILLCGLNNYPINLA